MNGPKDLRPLRKGGDFGECVADLGHMVVILAAMGCDEYPRPVRIEAGPLGRWRRRLPRGRLLKSIDHRIAGDEDLTRIDVLALQVLARRRSRRKVIRRDASR